MRPGARATELEMPMFDISLGPQEALPGLRGSPRVGHQLQSGRSFLQSSSPAEMSFLPPSPGDRRCSTGVKMKVGVTLEAGGYNNSRPSRLNLATPSPNPIHSTRSIALDDPIIL